MEPSRQDKMEDKMEDEEADINISISK